MFTIVHVAPGRVHREHISQTLCASFHSARLFTAGAKEKEWRDKYHEAEWLAKQAVVCGCNHSSGYGYPKARPMSPVTSGAGFA
jgi:hypothetical protein